MKKITKKELKKQNITINNNKKKNKNSNKTQTKKGKKLNNKIKKELYKGEKKSYTKKNNETNTINNNSNSFFKNHKLLSIMTSITLLVSLILMINYTYPIIKEKIELKEIKNEIKTILKNIPNNKSELEKTKKLLTEEITTSERIIIENNIENYLVNVIEYKLDTNELIKNENITNSLNASKIGKEEVITYYETTIIKLNEIKNNIEELKKTYTNIKIKSKKLKSQNIELLNLINDTITFKEIDETLKYINDTFSSVEYLINNKNFYEISKESLIFLKRKKFEEYQKLIDSLDYNNILKPTIIEDNVPPNISADNITIYKGNSINLKEKVKCIDAVDDEVECQISGTYNTKNVGEYKLTINSEDKSGNKSSKTIKIIVKEKPIRINTNNKPYYIEVIRNQNVVIVYGLDENKEYTKVVKVFVVSVGRSGKTPTGTYKTTKGQVWGSLIGGVYGQYSTRIVGSILFHSVPYYSKNKGDLEWEEYNKLGTAASAGCVRMTVRDVKWIYDNVSTGTTVRIYDGNLPKGITKPSAQKIPSNSPNKGWDPTDPDPNNPWKK